MGHHIAKKDEPILHNSVYNCKSFNEEELNDEDEDLCPAVLGFIKQC